jgi:hypothetical protein
MNTVSKPSIIAKASARSRPRSGVTSSQAIGAARVPA